MTATATPTPLPAPDFADWLSPILVKELRQGLKTRVFVGTFILVQVVMIVLMGLQLISLANGAGSGVSSAFEAFFWSFIWIAVLMLMPARGLTAISEETKANTLDLVQLTRLSAFRIVLGKWVALTTQTVMIIASILPYAVLRYFFGSVDIVEDLKNIAIILSVSLVLTAGTIALSTAHLAVRIIMIVGAFMTYVLLGTFMAARTFGVMSGGASIEYIGVWWFHLLTFPIYVYVLLEVAASKIATASENHSARKRSLALVLAVVLPASAAMKWEDFGEAWFVCFAPVWIWIVIEALCEKSSDVPSLYVPIVRRGALGKLGGRLFLYPGWASGMFFTFLLILCGVGAFELANLHSSNALKAEQLLAARILFVVFTASIISPLIMLLFMPRARQRMWFYILFQLLMALIYLICSIAADLPSGERSMAYRWLAPFPTSVIFASLQKSEDLPLMKFYLTTAVPVAVLLVLYLVFRAIREFGRIKAYEDEAALEANKAPIARR